MGPLTQEDPIGIAGGLNLYGYANGDPVNFSDPFGLCDDPEKPECRGLATAVEEAFKAWMVEKVMQLGALGQKVEGFFREIGGLFIEEAAATVVTAGLPVVGQVRAGRRVAAIGAKAGRFLSENRHLRQASVGARHDWAAAGVSADDVVGAIVQQSGWEASSGLVRGSVRIGGEVVDYSIFNREGGEAVLNAWMRGR